VMAGEGGMITTDDDAVADRCRLLRSHGMRTRYRHELLGYNFRMSDLHAAIGVVQMRRLAAITEKRTFNAGYLNERLRGVVTPTTPAGRLHAWHQYTVRLGDRDRDAAVARLADAGIGTGVFYPVPAHHQPHIRERVGDVKLPVTERLAREVVSLPVHPSLTRDELDHIVREVNAL
jgi:perosamine synthetase